MMLMLTSFGVGYYIMHLYNIDLSWLRGNESKWVIDSSQFFREIYPLASGVILISLFAYFIIATAVRRYKFFLASGQDYRKMISLADSIDDLTNPAQIAKLSNYPELQSILRNYGDQIKEISEEMDKLGEEERSVDLEMEIESVLKGKALQETIINGRWWAPLVRKIEAHINDHKDNMTALRKQFETGRRINGQVSLSLGRIMESINGSSEDILEIVRSVGGLNSVSKQITESGIDDVAGSACLSGETSKNAVQQIGNALRSLVENSEVLREFSDENNGLALNIALMAARGDASEQDLAQFAEKIRSTAERFNKLGRGLVEAVRVLEQNISIVRKGIGNTGLEGINTENISMSISDISTNIEKRSHSLQEKIISLTNEIELLDDEFHKVVENDPDSCREPEEMDVVDRNMEHVAPADGSSASFEKSESNASDHSRLVIDHGNMCEDADSQEEEVWSADDFGQINVMGNVKASSVPEPGQEISLDDFSVTGKEENDAGDTNEAFQEVLPPENIDSKEIAGDPEQVAQPGPRDGEDWMEMPGHRWVKINAEEGKPEEKSIVDPVATGTGDMPDMENEGIPEAGNPVKEVTDAIRSASVQVEETGEPATMPEGLEDSEPVCDLFELGAVEYVEKT